MLAHTKTGWRAFLRFHDGPERTCVCDGTTRQRRDRGTAIDWGVQRAGPVCTADYRASISAFICRTRANVDCIFRLIACHALIERSRSNAASQWLYIQANQ